MNEINQRKAEHLEAVLSGESERLVNGDFGKIRLIHRALPELDFSSINPSLEFLGKKLGFPLIIGSMTGGGSALIKKINQNLALAAEECQVAMAVGSQRIMFEDLNAVESFKLRQFAPNTLLFGNLGAVQLNYGFGENEVKRALQVLEAQAIFLHLNPLQEVIQKGGNTNFANLAEKIAKLTALNYPLIIKECGCGLSLLDIEKLQNAGIKIFDLSGTGGTSWSKIEFLRQQDDELGLIFQDWGISTALALKMAVKSYPNLSFIASGGIRNGIEMVKALILGAKICSISAPFLKAATISAEAVIKEIKNLEKQFKTAMFLLGCKNISELQNNQNLILKDDL